RRAGAGASAMLLVVTGSQRRLGGLRRAAQHALIADHGVLAASGAGPAAREERFAADRVRQAASTIRGAAGAVLDREIPSSGNAVRGHGAEAALARAVGRHRHRGPALAALGRALAEETATDDGAAARRTLAFGQAKSAVLLALVERAHGRIDVEAA